MPDDEDVASFPRTVHDDLRHRRFSWSNPKTATVNTKMNVPYEQLPLRFVYPGGENSTCLLSLLYFSFAAFWPKRKVAKNPDMVILSYDVEMTSPRPYREQHQTVLKSSLNPSTRFGGCASVWIGTGPIKPIDFA